MINRSDCKIETMRGTGPGGQHKNKKDTACRITHIPTGISAYADERSQSHSKKKAYQDLIIKLKELVLEQKSKDKKQKRDKAIKNTKIIRTYDYKSGVVKNHLNNKKASIKDVLIKGRIDLLK